MKIQSQVQLKTWLKIDTPEQSEVLYGSFDLYIFCGYDSYIRFGALSHF